MVGCLLLLLSSIFINKKKKKKLRFGFWVVQSLDSFWHLKSIQTFNPNESGPSELIRINPNETEFFGIIRIYSDWPDSFGLIRLIWIHSHCKFGLIRIDPIHSDSFRLQVRIDFEWASDWCGLKTITSDWFGINFNPELAPEQ